MDNENTTYVMTESEKSFINGLVKSMRKEVFDYLVEVVKENAELKAVTRDKVVEYLCNNRNEVKDILDTVDIDTDDVPESVADTFVDDWFSNAYNSDIIEKVGDLRDFVKDCIDEL